MEIKGWVRNSLIDFPDHIATVIFTGGCNFRCPMCHNADLVLHYKEMKNISEHEFFSFLDKRAGLIDGVVISGGEPTLQHDLVPFLQHVKDWDLDIKLDTNGSRPKVLYNALIHNVIDFVAMDIKAPREKYPAISGTKQINPDTVMDSLRILLDNSASFELRTTVVPYLLNSDDIENIAWWLASVLPEKEFQGTYTLQQFRGSNTLDPGLSTLAPYTKMQLEEMADKARRWLPDVRVRGV